MNERKKRKLLTYAVQSEVLQKFKAGVSTERIIEDYEISKATYYQIIKRKSEILKKVDNSATMDRKSSRQSSEKDLDDIMAKWFQQLRDRDENFSGRIIQDKALSFHEKLNGSPNFKASSGWLYKFKKRYGTQSLQKKECNDSEAIKHFAQKLKEKIEFEDLSLENIYNVDETGIYWKIPDFCTSETELSRQDDVNNRVTAVFCSNSTGNHRIPLLVIGDSATPNSLSDLITEKMKRRRLKFLKSLNVIYTNQRGTWMTKEIFKLWYKHIFIPNVLKHQQKCNVTGKVVLILDNAPCHPDQMELNAINSQFAVLYLAHNVPSSVQPMEQGIMSTAIKIYKRTLLMLLFQSNVRRFDQFLSYLNLKEFLISLNSAWGCLNSLTLQKAWTLILSNYCEAHDLPIVRSNKNLIEFPNHLFEEASSFPDLICYKIISRFSPGADCSIRKLESDKVILLKWFKTRDDFGWKPLTDDEIISSVMCDRKDEKMENDLLDVSIINETEERIEIPTVTIEDGNPALEKITLSELLGGKMVFDRPIQSEYIHAVPSLQQIRPTDTLTNRIIETPIESEYISEINSQEETLTEPFETKVFETLIKSEDDPEIYTSHQVTAAAMESTMFETPIKTENISEISSLQEVTSTEAFEIVPIKSELVETNEQVEIYNNYETDESEQVTSTEALDSLMKVKKWILLCKKSTQNHHHYIEELENLISEYCC